ncbi:MAG: glucoamylase family protein [Kosmotogaceae bacterium]
MKRYAFMITLLLLFALSLFGQAVIRDMEITEGINNDNTGAKFELNENYVYSGRHSIKIIPSGEAPETKMAFELSGEALLNWKANDTLELSIYIEENVETAPNSFFLGMADITDGWQWVDGVFTRKEIESGWNIIDYKLSPNMINVDKNGKYMLYFSFFLEEEEKIPLKDPFYVDHCVVTTPGESKVRQYVWTMGTQEEINTFDNDNTGATFELSKKYVGSSTGSMKVIPSGEAVETKIAAEIPAEKYELWEKSNQLIMKVYLPENMEKLPTQFFFGMADLTDGWEWVGGVFSETENIKPGWNDIHFKLLGDMQKVKSEGTYKVYIAFIGNEGGDKVPLTDSFYVDGIYAITTEEITREEKIAMVPAQIKEEVEKLTKLSDDELLEELQRKTFNYFWNEANPENGLIKDRSTDDSPCSIASVGFGLSAIPVAIENGWIDKEEGYDRALLTLKTFADGEVEGKNGFFYHFVNMNTGKRALDSEISSIDTSLFIAGALTVGEYFKGTEIEELATELYEEVDWEWMLAGGDTLSMGWKPEAGFLGARWDSFNEGILAYVLAIGSPKHPISSSTWDNIYRPVKDTYINLPQETLFVYQYPNIWVDFRNKVDHYANYFINAQVASRYNWLFTFTNRFQYETYTKDIWGLSACDGPNGYKAYGATEGNHDGTIAPYASIASILFTPDLSMNSLRAMLKDHGPLIWNEYGLVSGFNVDVNWYSEENIGIDQGDIILMIENYKTGLIWEYFMNNPHIQESMDKIGFEEKEVDYAVTPEYTEEFEELKMAPSLKEALAKKPEKTIKIDGVLDEWEDTEAYVVDEDMNVPAGGIQVVNKREQILHSNFFIKWDNENLYIAAEVYDEYLVVNFGPDAKGGFYQTDSVEFYIDPSKAGSNAGVMKLAILPFDTEGNPHAARHEDANPGPVEEVAPDIEIATVKTDYGYDLEVKIPFKYLKVNPRSGTELGFSYTIHNSNKKDAQPGQYVRENIISWTNVPEVWASPDKWGTLILE